MSHPMPNYMYLANQKMHATPTTTSSFAPNQMLLSRLPKLTVLPAPISSPHSYVPQSLLSRCKRGRSATLPQTKTPHTFTPQLLLFLHLYWFKFVSIPPVALPTATLPQIRRYSAIYTSSANSLLRSHPLIAMFCQFTFVSSETFFEHVKLKEYSVRCFCLLTFFVGIGISK